MLDAASLVEKHRGKGVLIDANLLVLLLVGTVNRRRILNFKRTSSFTEQDYDLLVALIDRFGKVVATPHVFSQACDLADLSGNEHREVRNVLKTLIEQSDEVYDPSRALVADPVFRHLGLADTAVASVGSSGVVVLTNDLDLYLALQKR